MKRITLIQTSILAPILALAAAGCSGEAGPGALDGVDSIVFLQRPARGAMGDIFNYQSYLPGARIVTLSPPTADGELKVVCCDQDAAFAAADISGYDLSFDAREIVFSAKLAENEKFGLYTVSLETGEISQVPTNPNHDYVQPVFVPGDRIFFSSNAVVEEGAPQFRDEYERRETAQVGSINRDGTEEVLGARNLSHRLFPAVLSDGRIILTHWDHLGEMNAGHLIIMNPDMTRAREAFGKEGTDVTNSFYKPREVSPGRVIAIGSSRDRTVQAGTILDIRLGATYTEDGEILADRDASEANASYRILTPQVPRGDEPSFQGVGRYFDAYPLNAKEHPDLLVSWADGPVEDGSLESAGLVADYGIYLYDSKRGLRRPIWNEEEYWDVFPQPLAPREAPPVIPASATNEFDENSVLIGSTNVYQTSLEPKFEEGSIYGVRVLEGFSSEEGLPRDFGMTEHEGSALLGVSPVRDDGSWAGLIPANVPVHVQVIDEFAMSLRSEPVWISGRKGESLLCNGCHEDRARAGVIQPGLTEALAAGPTNLRNELTRAERRSEDFSMSAVVGVPWDKALQPIFDAKCINCHDGDPAKPGNKTFTITDTASGESFTWTFDLRGTVGEYDLGEELMGSYSASHLSLMAGEIVRMQPPGVEVEGDVPSYVVPNHARDSVVIQKLNPPRLYPSPDLAVRAFDAPTHAVEQGFTDLTADEYHLLILMADSGGQFYSRENPPADPAAPGAQSNGQNQ